ncbi:MAG: methionine--tRNA ligase subunit beta [Planctomycetia bacterium]|nr:methionine--tRNA ligase subunit beta [Planctomycetia bacterium]
MTSDSGSESSSTPASPVAASPVPAPAAAKPAVITYDHFAQLDLRVAQVLEAREHPNANKLLLLKIKVGDIEKQIVAGIRGHYEPASLAGRSIVIVNNLAPALIRGEESNGMLLAASDGQSVVLLQPDKAIADGSKIK